MSQTLNTTHVAERASLPLFRQFIQDACEPSGIDEQVLYDLKLAADEAITNIVMYGYPESKPGEITLSLRCDPDRVVITITDRGTRYEPTPRDPPDLEEILAGERRVGGFGQFLMHQTMDEVRYETTNEGNHLTFVKYLGDGPGAE